MIQKIETMTIRFEKCCVVEFMINGENMLTHPISEMAVKFSGSDQPEILIAKTKTKALKLSSKLRITKSKRQET